ncbi:unnamed protein product [Ostreobium quekettii]|uniref:Uncharacterized protein n=1 Tax=Ostreobium quekettii TaxID=121088 RepID=A0A8S1IWZ6_9CHLO|nr:unnamed protein product [Ostreobium quekettii]|eukprot:evm.model.scf_732EXC.1 EVM.evm.TU.scf_732EXC.1   scf_732EXC:1413-7139(+)
MAARWGSSRLQMSKLRGPIPFTCHSVSHSPWSSQHARGTGKIRCTAVTDALEDAPSSTEVATQIEECRVKTMKEFGVLKFELFKRTAIAGSCFSAYLYLVASDKASIAALVGSVSCLAYLWMLCRSVDAIGPETKVPMKEAEKLPEGAPRKVAKLVASYRHALHPRLLVVVALGLGVWLYNSLSGDPLEPGEEGCLLLGFLVYKVALIQFYLDARKTKFDPEEFLKRPDFVELSSFGDLDVYGRKKEKPEDRVKL